jgi:hypothetical protein
VPDTEESSSSAGSDDEHKGVGGSGWSSGKFGPGGGGTRTAPVAAGFSRGRGGRILVVAPSASRGARAGHSSAQQAGAEAFLAAFCRHARAELLPAGITLTLATVSYM